MLVKDPMMYASENQDWKFWNVHPSKNNSHLAAVHSLPFSGGYIKHQIHISSSHTPLKNDGWKEDYFALEMLPFQGMFRSFSGEYNL